MLNFSQTSLDNCPLSIPVEMGSDTERAPKRRRLSTGQSEDNKVDQRALIHEYLSKPVSPPPFRRPRNMPSKSSGVTKSPFQLTHIRDLPESSNIDAVRLRDILGDPLISECWEFNYLHDVEFLMEQFDPDVRDLVKVHVIHGFWKKEDESRLKLIVCTFMSSSSITYNELTLI